MSGYGGGVAGDLFLQWFGCCTNQPAQRKRQVAQAARSRARIDRTMIGLPTNFQHTVHIGSGDVQLGSSHLSHLQNQMQSKGGYDKSSLLRAY